MCWDQDIPILPLESWSLAFPKLLSTQIIFPPNPILWERVECWETIIWSTRARSSSSTHHLLLLGEWCHLGASDKIVELNQEVCKGKEIAYFVNICPSEASPSWAMAMLGYTRLLLRGPILGGVLRGLAQPLPFMGWSLHQRGCTISPPIGTTAKTSMSPIAFALSKPFPLHSCKLHALLSAAHILFACLLELC